MKLSTRSRYGLKAMVDLALAYGEGCVSIASLAAQQGVSVAYLEQLIGSLRKAGLVTSSRGAQGGYALSRMPEEINVGEILQVLEGSTVVTDCVGTDGAACSNACSCSARPLWIKLQSRINEVRFATSLKDMVDDYKTQTERMRS